MGINGRTKRPGGLSVPVGLYLVVGLLALSLGGCGWGYANKMERDANQRPVEPAPVRTIQNPTIAPTPPAAPPPPLRARMQVGARHLDGLNRNHRASAGAKLPRDMRLHAFRLVRVDAFTIVDRWVHCTSGEVIEAKRRDSSLSILESMTAQGVPPSLWVLRVDPSGQRMDLANNDWYRHIVKFHRLEYVGRDETSGLVTYRYLGPQ